MEIKDANLESSTISALLSYSPTARHANIREVLTQYSSPLKSNFENRNLWLRFGLTLSMVKDSPRSALQAFNECIRIDQYDPLPAMLAAKLLLEDLDDPEKGIELAEDAIERCRRLAGQTSVNVGIGNHIVDGINNNIISNGTNSKSSSESGNLDTSKTIPTTSLADSHYLEAKCCYKNVAPLLSKCYLLASIMHAHIYEREPESMKQFKISDQIACLNYLKLALETYPDDYLIYFHKALHDAKQKSYQAAIDNLQKAIKLNSHHVPSMQLLILSLSALRRYEDALSLCESLLQDYEDNLLLLYIKCNLEQCLFETKGYKSSLETAQYLLKCFHRKPTAKTSLSSALIDSSGTDTTTTVEQSKQATSLFPEDSLIKEQFRQELIPEELTVWLFVAETFIKIGSISDAELCIDEASNHVNGALSYQILFARGLISKSKNNLIEAKRFFQSCLALQPRHARALQQVGHVHYLLGNHSTAEKFLKDSLNIDNDCFKTWHYLSLVYIETNQHEKANECIKRSTVLEESSPVIPLSVISRLTLV